MPQCAYCKQAGAEKTVSLNSWDGIGRRDQDFYYCSDNCRQAIEDFNKYVNQNATRFLILIGIIVFTISLGSILMSDYVSLIIGTALFFLGIIIIKYPFATPQTNQWLGIKKAILLTRILGALLGLLGLKDILIYFKVY